MEDTNGFKQFINEAMQVLEAKKVLSKTNSSIGKIILSGHSGGYHVIAAIVDRGGIGTNIQEVWLFDALYGGVENFVAWQKNARGRLLDIYTDHGGTKSESEKLIGFYQTNKINFSTVEDTNASPENLRTNNLVFLHSDMIHNDVVARRETFRQFLATSCLENQ